MPWQGAFHVFMLLTPRAELVLLYDALIALVDPTGAHRHHTPRCF